MRWYRLYIADESIGAEAIEDPMFIHRQANGVIDLCNEAHAQGIVSADESTYYLLDGRASLGEGYAVTAVEISGAEYDEILRELPDPEDNDPEVPEGSTDPALMTRAELTAKVREQDEEIRSLNEQIELLLSGVTA